MNGQPFGQQHVSGHAVHISGNPASGKLAILSIDLTGTAAFCRGALCRRPYMRLAGQFRATRELGGGAAAH